MRPGETLKWAREVFGRSDGEATRGLVQRLEEETRRALRYNHFLTLAVFSSQKASAQEICDRIQPELRSTDAVDIISTSRVAEERDRGEKLQEATATAKVREGERVGVIFIETDGHGAKAAVARLNTVLLNMDDLNVGIAVYPVDSSRPDGLLTLADPMGL